MSERRSLVAGLVAPPPDIVIVEMRLLSWRMAELCADHSGLSTLGAEAVASALHLTGSLLVSSRDDGPGIRQCCAELGIDYAALER